MIEYLIAQSEILGNFNINNNITQDYIDYILDMPSEDYASILLDYGIDVSNNIYMEIKMIKNVIFDIVIS